MHRLLSLFLPLLLLWGSLGLDAQEPLPPAPRQWVTDTQGVLSPAKRAILNRRLAQYEKATGHQVLVWIGGSIGGGALEDWSARTFESWKAGRSGKDDGLVLFILARDRKLRIEVGYGLEGQVPDAVASRIIREAITPRLAAGDWDGAVEAGVDGLLAKLGGETREGARAEGARQKGVRSLSLGQIILLAILGLGFLVLLVTHPSLAIGLIFSLLSGGRGGGGGGSGGWSGGGGRSGGGGASGSW